MTHLFEKISGVAFLILGLLLVVAPYVDFINNYVGTFIAPLLILFSLILIILSEGYFVKVVAIISLLLGLLMTPQVWDMLSFIRGLASGVIVLLIAIIVLAIVRAAKKAEESK